MGAVRMCVCQSERVRHARKDVVQYCYDVMQWRWFNVCIRWRVFIVCTDSIICYRFQQEKDGERKAKRTPRFYEHVFVFTYNLSWIIRVKVEVLMEVTIHIYCLLIFFYFFFAHLLLSAQGGTAEACEWQLSISVLVYGLLFIQNCHRFHLKSVYFCNFFFPPWESSWVSARNAVNIKRDVGVLRGFRFSHTHCWFDASTESIRATAQF